MTQSPPPKEQELLEGLDAYTSHADELAESLAGELEPKERMKGSVEDYEAPFEPLDDWEHSDVLSGEDDQRE